MLKQVVTWAFVGLVLSGGLLRANEDVLKSVGPLAFNSDGVLFVGDPLGASIFAIETNSVGESEKVSYDCQNVDKQIAGALGVEASDIVIEDMAVHPKSGLLYFSVSRGKGPDAIPVLLTMDSQNKISELDLTKSKYTKAELPNAPSPDSKDRRGASKRTLSITDLSFINNQVVIAGLSNEQFESNLRAISYPFSQDSKGTAVEVYHGAHGRYETNAPIRTFTSIMINNEPSVIAAYTCTPLVRFPMNDLAEGQKIQGTTVAELGNRNQPLDMIVYEKDGKEFLLMANSARGMMKISTEDIGRDEGITAPVTNGGKAGQSYENIESLASAIQLDRLNSKKAVVIQKNPNGGLDLITIDLP